MAKKKFWTIKMDMQGVYDVAPVTFVREDDRPTGGKFYRLEFEHEGVMDSIVVDIKDKDIFSTQREALIECARRCREVAAKWTARADDCLVRATGK